MKAIKKMGLALTALIIGFLVYQLSYSYTIFRISLRPSDENIVGKKYTTINLINPIKIKQLKKSISLELNRLDDLNITEEKKEYLKDNLLLENDFEVLDVYEEDNKIYVFTKIQQKEEKKSINKLLFLLSKENLEVEKVLF